MTNSAKPTKHPSDRDLALAFAAEPSRNKLKALFNWVDEVEHVPVRAQEPAIQAMRFAWHREAVADLYTSPRKVRRHATYEGLAGLLDEGCLLGQAELTDVIDGIEGGVSPEPIVDLAALTGLIDEQAGSIMRAGLRVAGENPGDVDIENAARAAGLAQWIRQFAFRANRLLPLIPQPDMEAAGLNAHRLATGREPELAKQAFAGVIGQLDETLKALKSAGAVPASVLPVLATARLARATLHTARKSSDLYRTDFSRPLFLRQFDLICASLSGRL